MLTLPQTAEYALRSVNFIAEHQEEGPVPVSVIARSLGAPQNYLSKTLHQLGAMGVLQSVRGAQGGYRLGRPAGELRLADIIEPFLPEQRHRCIMGHSICADAAPCGAHHRWKQVQAVAADFFGGLTVADLLQGRATPRLSRTA